MVVRLPLDFFLTRCFLMLSSERAELVLPFHKPELNLYPAYPQFNDFCKDKFGSYETRTALTAMSDVGRFVGRIVDDSRTLNHYVFCWGDEVNQTTIVKTVEELSPVKF